MSVLPKLASALERNDEIPNVQLANVIAQAEDHAAVRELVENLGNANKDIQSDCIKVLYEVGVLKPHLIAEYAEVFVKLLSDPHNRMVWGAMTALGTIANLRASELWNHLNVIIDVTENGSVITQDWGIRVLAALNAQGEMYAQRIFPFLIEFLRCCPAKDLPRHAESLLVTVNDENRAGLLAVLEGRRGSLKSAQLKRIDHVIKKIHG